MCHCKRNLQLAVDPEVERMSKAEIQNGFGGVLSALDPNAIDCRSGAIGAQAVIDVLSPDQDALKRDLSPRVHEASVV